jgi:phage-related minor tail protein
LLVVVVVALKLIQVIQALHQELEQVVLVVEAKVVTMDQEIQNLV